MTTTITTTKSFSVAAAARWRGGDDRDEVEEGEGGDATAMPRRIACALSDLTSYLTSILSLVGRGTTVCTASTSTSTSSAAAALTHPDDRRRSYP
jgi:hypothetical protein